MSLSAIDPYAQSYPPELCKGFGGFDPSVHTIGEVKAYLADRPDARGQILGAERAGRARSTLVAWLEEHDG